MKSIELLRGISAMADHRKLEDTFDTFVKNQQPDKQPVVDWARVRNEWLKHLDELYHRIESFLAKYIKAGTITRDYVEIPLNEENIGKYTARRMVLRIGRQQIHITPFGTVLIGTRGRVDVEGPGGHTRFVLVDSAAAQPQPRKEKSQKNIRWVWKIATSPPKIQYIELNQD